MNDHTIQLDIVGYQKCSFPRGITPAALARELSTHYKEKIVAIEVDGQWYDSTQPLTRDAQVRVLSWDDAEGKKIFWASTAQLLAAAIAVEYPKARLGAGGITEQGFYYDVDFGDIVFDTTHMGVLQKKMVALAKAKLPCTRKVVPKIVALAHEGVQGNAYKQARVVAVRGEQVGLSVVGKSVDIDQGPLLWHTGAIKACKLHTLSAAYWQGDSSKPQLTRIAGVSFPDKKKLTAYEAFVEEAAKRDHRKLGAELGFFTFASDLGLGLPLWLPRGAYVREQLMRLLAEKLTAAGYAFVSTPHIADTQLYQRSGHYDKYSTSTFSPITTPHEGESLLLKPMNCPHHCLVYKSAPRSYRDLPYRVAEFGTVYRYEQHGELHGLTRTRCFTQDDGHSFCRPSDIQGELVSTIELITDVFRKVGFTQYTAQLSLRDPSRAQDYIGTAQEWQVAEEALVEATRLCGLATVRLEGEAAFYGPKVDFMVKDNLHRSWQLGTIQLDYQLPRRLGLTYMSAANTAERPVLIHRAAVGSLERFIGILLEHTAGRLPLWLCRQHVALLPIAQAHIAYAEQVAERLKKNGIAVQLDRRSERIARKLRDALAAKVPYSIVVGAREMQEGTLTVRTGALAAQRSMSVELLVQEIKEALRGG